jgi:hypothetical protein
LIAATRPRIRARFLEADQTLSKKAMSLTSGYPLRLSGDDLAKLETVVENAKDEFTTTVLSRLRQLRTLIGQINASPNTIQPALVREVKSTAYEIKGLGTMFGFPNLTSVASMRHNYVDRKPRLTNRQVSVVGIHIDLLYMILAQRLTQIPTSLESELMAALALLVARWP